MPLFRYTTMDSTGKRTEGTLEVKDKFELYHTIKKDGNTVVFTEEIQKTRNIFSLNSLSFLNTVSMHEKIMFARNLSKMLDAGLPITRALSIMEREASGSFKKVLKSLNESLSRGTTLSDSMKSYPRVFSTLFVSMVKSGEESGNLTNALQNVALQMEKTYTLNKKIKGALMYPAIIVILMIIIGALMMVYMVPTLTSTFKGLGLQLPISTRIIIWVSDFMVAYFIYVVLGAIVFVSLLTFASRTPRGHKVTDYLLLKIPVIKDMVKQANSARTARTLSSLLASGVDVMVATGVTKEVLQNSYYKKVLEEVQTTIQKGGTISSVFSSHEKLYPIFVTEMVSVGEETGKISEMLMNVALFYEEEIDQRTKDLSSIIEPLLMVFIGLGVGLFAISIIGPIYSIGDSIN